MKKIEFTKMHGLGNDMIVIDGRENGFTPSAEQAVRLGDRRFGIGADQILVLLASESADYKMRIFNADGSEVEMCGNGIRCLARFIHDRGLSSKNPLAIETLAGIVKPELLGELVRVDVGEPVFEPTKIPVRAQDKLKDVMIRINGDTFKMSALSMGNPHCVIAVDEVDKVPLHELGPRIEHHPWFPNRTNVEFVQVMDRGRLKVRVWERGAGATLACGTGACASVVAMADLDRINQEATVTLPGGDLEIQWDRETNRVWMTGPAIEVFQGVIAL